MAIIITEEIKLENFEAWSGGHDRLETIKELGLVDEAEAEIEAMTEWMIEVTKTTINDILWFEMDNFIEEHTRQELQKINEDTLDDFKTYEGYEGSYIVENYIRYKDMDTILDFGNDLDELMCTYEDNEDVVYYYIGLDGKAYAPNFG